MSRLILSSRARCCSLLLLLLFVAMPLLAQRSIRVGGTVTDEKKEPLAGVSVLVKGTAHGTSTDLDGKFSISNVPSGAILEVSFVGMKTLQVPAREGQMTIVLQEDNGLLDDLVVVGYGTQRKVNLSGAVAAVDKKSLEARPLQNLASGLQGLVPGLAVTGMNGAPGLDNGILRVRGTGTLNAADPYILIDGVESGTLNAIDPSDIESISVLKDASSAAIYGSKASNGVILITTKRGRSGQTQVSYSGYVSAQNATNVIERMGSGEYAERYNELLVAAGGTPRFTAAQIEKFYNGTDPNYPNTDWYNLAYKTGVMHRHNVNISGGADNARYMASVGYLNQTGILPNAVREQFNARTNLDMTLSKKFQTKLSLAFIKNEYAEPSSVYAGGSVDQIIRQLNVVSPWIPNRLADGSGYGTVSDGNPIAWLDLGSVVNRNNQNFSGNAALIYNATDDLKFTASTSYTSNVQEYDYFQKFIKYNNNKSSDPNSLRERFYRWNRLNVEVLGNYTKSFGDHNLAVLGGWSLEDYNYAQSEGFRKTFPNNLLTDLNAGDASTQTNGGFSRRLAMLSYFGRINYDYAGKYLLEANLRADASSRFADGHRWGYFPSFSAAWRISQESFMQGASSWLSDLKIRASWGMLGNQDALDDYYPAISTYAIGAKYPFDGTLNTGYSQNDYKLSTISWEKSTTIGIGLDFGFLNNRITGSLDVYDRKTTDMLMDVTVPREFALNPYKDNVGSVDNKGIELSLAYRDRWGDWTFGAAGNFAYNRNEIVDLGGAKWLSNTNEWNTRNAVGQPVATYYLYKADGLFASQAEADAFTAKYGNPFGRKFMAGDLRYVDTNGDGKLTGDDRIYEGSPIPAYTFGLNLNAGYKDFDLSLMFNGAAKVHRLFSGEVWGMFGGDTGHPSTAWRNAWSESNPGGTMPRMHLDSDSPSSAQRVSSTFWLQDMSYLRLKNLQLGYTLPRNLASTLGVGSVRLYYSVENLFTLDKLDVNVDPEVTGYRLSSYPLLRTHAFGINVTF